MVQHRNDVIPRMRLGVARSIFRHVGGRKAARVVGDAAEVAREEPQLRLPAAVIAGELVHEHERRAAAALLVIQAGGALLRGGGAQKSYGRNTGGGMFMRPPGNNRRPTRPPGGGGGGGEE